MIEQVTALNFVFFSATETTENVGNAIEEIRE